MTSKVRREFPEQPLVGVGGVVVHRNRVLLIRRGSEPLKGQWSIPGGLLELGEELAVAVRRELKEETGLTVEPVHMLEVFDRIVRRGRRVQFHFVIVDYACRVKGGWLRPASDVLDARWASRKELPQYHLTAKATSVVLQGLDFFRKAGRR